MRVFCNRVCQFVSRYPRLENEASEGAGSPTRLVTLRNGNNLLATFGPLWTYATALTLPPPYVQLVEPLSPTHVWLQVLSCLPVISPVWRSL